MIAACVIGGVSIAGGVGTVGSALLGAIFLGVIGRALPVIGVSPFWQMAISGAAIIVAVALNARAERKTGRIILKGGGVMSTQSMTLVHPAMMGRSHPLSHPRSHSRESGNLRLPMPSGASCSGLATPGSSSQRAPPTLRRQRLPLLRE